jgi:serine protease Do
MAIKTRFLKKVFATVILMTMIPLSTESFAQTYSQDERINITVYQNVAPAIVAIDADIDEGVSSGTGCIIDPDGLILTSSHVVEGCKDIKITLADGKTCTGKIVANNNAKSDFALIKITPPTRLQTIKLGDSSNVKVGQKVLAIGNPFGFNRTLTTGIISRVDTEKNKIQTDAAINPGSSGGPLLNVNGEVIGINQSIYNPDNNKSNIGIGFAVPVNVAKSFINEVKNTKPDIFGKNARM